MPVNTYLKYLVLCLGLLALVSVSARADGEQPQAEDVPRLDEIVLKDGSRILGKIRGARDGAISVKTDFAGTISIRVDQVATLRTSKPAVVMLADEQVLESDSIEVGEEQMTLGTGEAGARTYALDDLLILNPEPWEMGRGYKWTGLASFAWVMERGNSDTDELDYKLETVWRSKQDRYTVKFNGEIDKTNDQKNADNWRVIAKYDYFVSEQTYWGINGFAESDKFADLDLRWFVGPYIGREFLTDPLFMLSAEVGASWVEEDFITAEDQDYPAANWAVNMSSNYLGGNSRLYFDQLGVWNLNEASEVIVKTSIGLSFPLLWNFEAATEVLWEYDSGAVDDIDELDETYRFRIGYSW